MFKFYTGIFITSSNCCTGRCFPFFHFKSFFFYSSMNLLAAICCIGGGLHNEHRPIVAQVLCIMPSPQRSFLQSWVSHINLFDYPHVTTLLNVHPTTDCWCVRVALFYCTFFNTFSIRKESFHITLEGGGVFFLSLLQILPPLHFFPLERPFVCFWSPRRYLFTYRLRFFFLVYSIHLTTNRTWFCLRNGYQSLRN